MTSDPVNSLAPQEEVFYRRLLSIVDDYGRYDGRPSILRAQLYPLQLDRIRETDVVRGLAACEKASLIRCYKVEGKAYVQVGKFGQQVRATKSKWPEPPDDVGECAGPYTNDNGCKRKITDAHLDEGVVGDEDECATPKPPQAGAGVVDSFVDALWEIAPKMARQRSSKAKVRAEVKRLGATRLTVESMTTAYKAWLRCEQWTKSDGEFVPGLHRWVKDRQFEDVPDAAESSGEESSDLSPCGPVAMSRAAELLGGED